MDAAVRVDGSAGHGASGRQSSKQAIHHVVDAEEDELLTLVDTVVVSQSKGFANAKMLHRHGNEGRKAPTNNLLQKGIVVVLGRRQALGVDLGYRPGVIGFAAVSVDEKRNERVDDEENDGSARGGELDPFVRLAPSLAHLLQGKQQHKPGEANA